MREIRLNKIFASVSLLLLLSAVTSSYPKDLYKWVDNDGRLHFTDDPSKVPIEKKLEAEVIRGNEKSQEAEVEVNVDVEFPEYDSRDADSKDEETAREFWRSRSLEIENRKNTLAKEIEITKERAEDTKRYVDYLLTNGYSADYYVLELRYLEDYRQELEIGLSLIVEEEENLKREARREGIPPGYLRP